MIVFWLVAVVLLLAALFFIVPPLTQNRKLEEGVERDALNVSIYKDHIEELDADLANDIISQEQYEKGKEELERRLLQDVKGDEANGNSSGDSQDKKTAVITGVFIAVFSVSIYIWLGSPKGLNPEAVVAEVAPDAQHPNMEQQLGNMVSQLATKLEQNPEDYEGWMMLARSYYVLGQPELAVDAFSKAMPLVENNSNVLTDYADALAMATGGTLEGRPVMMLHKALELDPNNQKALWLAGTREFDRKRYDLAIGYWQRLLPMLPAGSQDAEAMSRNIAEARSLMEQAGMSVPESIARPVEEVEPQVAVSGFASVAGRVSLSEEVQAKADGNDTLYVFARAESGPRMPLAIMKARVKDLPLAFLLDDSLAVMPAMRLSQADKVIVGARISKSGDATPQPGDLEGFSTVVPVGADGVQVVINQVVP